MHEGPRETPCARCARETAEEELKVALQAESERPQKGRSCEVDYMQSAETMRAAKLEQEELALRMGLSNVGKWKDRRSGRW